MAGRKPVPDAIKDLTGSHNKRNGAAPRFYFYRDASKVPCPKHVLADGYAKQEWDESMPELVANGLLCRANLKIFAFYCLAVAEAEHAIDDVNERGRTIEEPVFARDGAVTGARLKPNASIQQANAAVALAKTLAVEFGMTPSAATRVERAGEGGDTGFDEFLNPPEQEEDGPADDKPRPN